MLAELCDNLNLATRNQAYTVLQAVQVVFRRLLSPTDALRFAGLLPAVARAIFVVDWKPNEHRSDFGSEDDLYEEVRAVRRNHNFAERNAIGGVTQVLRRHMNPVELETFLTDAPPVRGVIGLANQTAAVAPSGTRYRCYP